MECCWLWGGDVQRGVLCIPHARGVWGHAPPGKFWNLDPLRSLLVHFHVIPMNGPHHWCKKILATNFQGGTRYGNSPPCPPLLTITASRCFSTDLPLGGLVVFVHVNIFHTVEMCSWVLQMTSCFIIGENLIFTIHQTAKWKSSPIFPAVYGI